MLRMRSLLFVPGNREQFLEKACALNPDAFIVDLEDSVPQEQRDAARQLLRNYAPRLAGKPIWVRVNAVGTADIASDIEAAVGLPGFAGLFVPKIELISELGTLDRLLVEREITAKVRAGSTKLVLQVESARAVWSAFELASATPRVLSLCFASARDGDLMTDLGCDWTDDGASMTYARAHTLLGMRAARCAVPLDGVFADIRDHDAFERDTRLSRSLGYRGRTVIHPSQIELANRIYSPTLEELDRSKRLLELFDAATAAGRASVTFEGRMIDIAMAKNARRIIESAEQP